MSEESKTRSDDVASQLQELASRAIREQVRNNQKFADLLQRIARGELDEQEVRQEFRSFSEHESNEYVRTLTAMGVSFFANLIELNRAYNERFFQRIAHDDSEGGDGAGEAHARLALRGPLGAVVRGSFLVQNTRSEPTDISAVVLPLRRSDGSTFQAPFVIRPTACRVEAGDERSIEVFLELLTGLFQPGETCHGRILVRGVEDLILDLDVTAELAPAEMASAGARAPSASPAAASAVRKTGTKTAREATKKAPKKAKKKAAKKAAKRAPKKVKKKAAKKSAKKAPKKAKKKSAKKAVKKAVKKKPASKKGAGKGTQAAKAKGKKTATGKAKKAGRKSAGKAAKKSVKKSAGKQGTKQSKKASAATRKSKG